MKGDMPAQNSQSPATRRPGIRHAPRGLIPALVLALIMFSIGLVAISPFALDAFGDSPAWTRRSEICQTYGAAAALLSIFALVGITASLILQAREAKISREQASRTTHTELLLMAIEKPVFRECWGPVRATDNETELQQHIYTNLVISDWQSRFELGNFTETHVRAGASDMFTAAPGRRFWAATRAVRFETAQGRRARRFHQPGGRRWAALATSAAHRRPHAYGEPAAPDGRPARRPE